MSGPGNLTTSGVSTFNPIATQIITGALRICAAINDAEQPTQPMIASGLFTLNSMMKELEATGYHVWTEEEYILFPQQNQVRYLIGGPNGSPDHIAYAFAYAQTTLAAAAVIGATTAIIVSASGIAEGNYFAVVLDGGAAFWTTVTAISGTTVQFADALPAMASAQQLAFCYATPAIRPLRVPFARRFTFPTGYQQGGIITPMDAMLSRQEYFDLPQPNNTGIITQCYYNPSRDQGEFYVWNAPSNATQAVRFTGYRPLQDFSSSEDQPDLPQEWGNCLMWNLARELAPQYNVSAERWQLIGQQSAAKLELMMGWDREPESIHFGRSGPQSRSGR